MKRLIACVLVLGLMGAVGCSRAFRARKAAEKGDSYLRTGRFVKAHKQYAHSFALRPAGHVAFKNAYALNKLGENEGSLEALFKAAELGIDEARILLASYGGVSTDDIREYVRTHEDDAYAWTALGERHYRGGEYPLAAQAYESALKNCADADLGKTLTYNLSVAYLKSHRYPEAARAFDAYAARSGTPLTDNELLLLGSIRYAHGDRAGAAVVWSKLPTDARKLIVATVGDEGPELAELATGR